MTYAEYIEYHLQGDAGVEDRMLASLAKHYALSDWDAFRLIYFYTMTYHIPSALAMLEGERNIKHLKFRTDRRWVGIVPERFERLLCELSAKKQERLRKVNSTQEAYNEVNKWYYFSRYAAQLLLENYINIFKPDWDDDFTPDWEKDENYTNGAVLIVGAYDVDKLNKFLVQAKKDTKSNAFDVMGTLCAFYKMVHKGTRYNGYYTERMLNEAAESPKYGNLIIKLAK